MRLRVNGIVREYVGGERKKRRTIRPFNLFYYRGDAYSRGLSWHCIASATSHRRAAARGTLTRCRFRRVRDLSLLLTFPLQFIAIEQTASRAQEIRRKRGASSRTVERRGTGAGLLPARKQGYLNRATVALDGPHKVHAIPVGTAHLRWCVPSSAAKRIIRGRVGSRKLNLTGHSYANLP